MFIFYHEFDSVSSGAAVVIINLVKGLLAKNEKVLLIAKVDGELHNNLKEAGTENLIVINNEKAAIISKASEVCQDDTIITTHFYSIFRLFKRSNPKIIFYCVNTISLNLANRYFNRFNLKSVTRKLVSRIGKDGGLVFVDEFAKEENEKLLGVVISDPEYLPIPVDIPERNLWLDNTHRKNELSFTYVGRAADWKIFPVRKVLIDINTNKTQNSKVVFHIITDNAKEFGNGLKGIDDSKVLVKYHENLSPLQLNDFLVENSSLHFAMGTSALDGAKLGVPTVLLDFSFEEFPEDYRYNFLFSTRKYSVGNKIRKGELFIGHTMDELISGIRNEKTKKDFSDRCYQHVKSYHDVHETTNMVLRGAEKCNVHIKDISKYLIRYWR